MINISFLHCVIPVKNNTIIEKEHTIYIVNLEVEKTHLTSIAATYNNPGNLRPVNGKGFRYFETLEDGYCALIRDIIYKQTGKSRYLNGNNTLKDFVYVYAPPIENNSSNYLRIISTELGVNINTKIKDIAPTDLARVIIMVEDHNLYELIYHKITHKEIILT